MSTTFPQRVTRYSFVLFDRGSWGSEEVTVEEVRPDRSIPPHWEIHHRGCAWSRKVGEFINPHGDNQWAAVRYPTAEDALAEAPRACAAALKRYAKQVACYDAEHAREGTPS